MSEIQNGKSSNQNSNRHQKPQHDTTCAPNMLETAIQLLYYICPIILIEFYFHKDQLF
jgi:hypothetical protein